MILSVMYVALSACRINGFVFLDHKGIQIRYTHLNTENILKAAFLQCPYRQKNKQRPITSRLVRYEMAGVLFWDMLKAKVHSNYPHSVDDLEEIFQGILYSVLAVEFDVQRTAHFSHVTLLW